MALGSRDGSGGAAALTPIPVPAIAHVLEPARVIAVPAFDDVYTAHVAFVWRILRTFGVPPDQVEDAVQDVFVVVHRRLPEFEGRAAITTWLFAIARRVAGSHRRRAGNTKTEALSDELVGKADTFAEAARAEAAATVVAILQDMDEDKRVVFALVELEQLTVPEVAKLLDVNLNTTYSRLRLARALFEQAVQARVKR